MDPFSASMGIEVAVGVVDALIKSRKHAQHLLDAVRGAKNKKSVWYALCQELGDSCKIILPLLDKLETEMVCGEHMRNTREAIEDVMDVLGSALRDGADLVVECQTASKTTLFMRGDHLKEKFRKVADRIAKCLRNIPLASFLSTARIQEDVGFIVKRLETARFELSEEDRAIFKDMREVIDNQGVQSEDHHLATLSVLRQMEKRLNMNVSDIRQEIRATQGNGAVDLDAKEQKFMSQIIMLLSESSSSAGGADAGSNSKSARKSRSGPPASLTCPITLELMRDPVVDCFGHTYERRAITKALMHKPGVSPKTNKPYPGGDPNLLTNFTVRDSIEEYLETKGIDVGEEVAVVPSTTGVPSEACPPPPAESSINADVPTPIQAPSHISGRHSASARGSSSGTLACENSSRSLGFGVETIQEDHILRPGLRVRLVGMARTPQLNGRVGTCIEFVEEQWTVALDGVDQNIVNVSESNLEAFLATPPTPANPSSPPSSFSICPVSMSVQVHEGSAPSSSSGGKPEPISLVMYSPETEVVTSEPRGNESASQATSAIEAHVPNAAQKSFASFCRRVVVYIVVVAVLTIGATSVVVVLERETDV
mmetsp:Transcript_42495/g.81190  ORF Transcript_42495/g.81190 Transcript_42495/m.81190 type:complete len:598 (-) Transcript_42495:510-2303(-)